MLREKIWQLSRLDSMSTVWSGYSCLHVESLAHSSNARSEMFIIIIIIIIIIITISAKK